MYIDFYPVLNEKNAMLLQSVSYYELLMNYKAYIFDIDSAIGFCGFVTGRLLVRTVL